ncbi:MAG: prepilin-type N-terminal cleavage/methylation domain-containing protein [Firmicutes bacterium]|nr:prepilin-type N-terminal cleavage/methylation domain-containing protein [Bacillota bacterium]
MKKGFTLVELLAIIAILSIIMLIGSYSITGVLNSFNKNALETKLDSILDAAIMYGQEKSSELTSTCSVYNETYNACKVLTVKVLLDTKFLETKEKDGIYLNPVTKIDMANDEVYVYRKNNRFYASIKDVKSCLDLETNEEICNLE